MLHISQDQAADQLVSENPLALLIAMVLDQQIPLEKAFRSPYDLKERMGGRLEAAEIAGMDPDKLAKIFSTPPALHRFPGSMAGRVQEVCRVVAEDFDGDAAAVWKEPKTGAELLKALKKLPGFGEQKAKIFLALLGKQLGVRPKGWEEAAGPYGEKGTHRSIADITGPQTLEKVRAFKKEMKAAAKADAAAKAGEKVG
jgi:uncharacterized HhH-GPD family protein